MKKSSSLAVFLCVALWSSQFCESLLFFEELPPSSLQIKNNPKLLVNSSKCSLVDWPLFDDDTRPMYANLSESQYQCWADTKFNQVRVERVNLTWIQIEFADTANNWSCRISDLNYDVEKDKIQNSKYLPYQITKSTLINLERNVANRLINDTESQWDLVMLQCYQELDNDKNDIDSDDNSPDDDDFDFQKIERVIPLVQTKKFPNQNEKNPKPNHQPNVLLLGVDSVSRLNFLRHFLETREFLEKQGFVELKGHHKIGENTFPNLFGILTGNTFNQQYHTTKDKANMDQIPMIFGNYSANGYVTTFMEDMSTYGLFNYRATISKQPTDYYLRPVSMAVEQGLSNNCYLGQIESKFYLDYLLDLLELFRIELDSGLRHLTMAHISSFTHNVMNNAGYADHLYRDFFESFFASDYHHNTFVVFYSDHGIRFGDITYTRSGQYEQRLPFLWVYVPESANLSGMGQQELRKRLEVNQNRLTSQLDLHATLMHLLTGDETVANGGLFGRSLFGEIPFNRSCEQAGIGDHYCMCNQFVPLPQITDLHGKIAIALVKYLNQLLHSHRHLCHKLSTGAVLKVMERERKPDDDESRHLLVQFTTKPNRAIFEATVTFNNSVFNEEDNLNPTTFRNHALWELPNWYLTGPISRLNRYGRQSHCLGESHYILRVYCYCLY